MKISFDSADFVSLGGIVIKSEEDYNVYIKMLNPELYVTHVKHRDSKATFPAIGFFDGNNGAVKTVMIFHMESLSID